MMNAQAQTPPPNSVFQDKGCIVVFDMKGQRHDIDILFCHMFVHKIHNNKDFDMKQRFNQMTQALKASSKNKQLFEQIQIKWQDFKHDIQLCEELYNTVSSFKTMIDNEVRRIFR